MTAQEQTEIKELKKQLSELRVDVTDIKKTVDAFATLYIPKSWGAEIIKAFKWAIATSIAIAGLFLIHNKK